jgi:ATPase subunit of ABC transporter with duplicated ATPase domains
MLSDALLRYNSSFILVSHEQDFALERGLPIHTR